MRLFDIAGILAHRGMVVHCFGNDLRECSQEELIALVAWVMEQNQRLSREVADQSIAHIHDLASMRKAQL